MAAEGLRRYGFKPGKSGNPSGRPKNPFPALIREATKDGSEIVATVLSILREVKTGPKLRLACCEFLRDTGWHKPITLAASVDTDGNDVVAAIQFIPAKPADSKR